MKIIWQIEDGYVGKGRPQKLEIPDEEMEDMTEPEKQNYIISCIQNDFENTVSFSFEIMED